MDLMVVECQQRQRFLFRLVMKQVSFLGTHQPSFACVCQDRWSLQGLVEEYILRNNILQQAFSSISTPEVPVVGVTPQNLRAMHEVADSR